MSRPFCRLGLVATAAALLAGGCGDGFFAPSAPGITSASLDIRYQIVPGETGGAAEAFDRADSVRVRLLRSGGPGLDTTLALPEPGSTRQVSLSVELDQSEVQFQMALEMRAAGAAIFTAEAPVTLKQGEAAKAEPELVPVLAAIHVEELYGPLTAIGAALNLSAHGLFATGDTIDGFPLRWETLDPGIISLTEGGRALALAEGQARLRVSGGALSTESLIEVRAEVAAVEVTPESLRLEVGRSARLEATIRDANGNALVREASYSSTNTRVASVDAEGDVTGVAEGEAEILVSAGDAPPARTAVTVVPVPAASVVVDPSTVSITAGATQRLTATVLDADGNELPGRPVTWSSDRPGIATVSPEGLVTAVAEGEAVIQARSGTAPPARVSVTVTPVPAASVVVDPSTLSITVGGTQRLTATVLDAAGNELPGRPVTWSSDRPGIASVSPEGIVTAVAEGEAVIQATSGTASPGRVGVTVGPAPAGSIVVEPAEVELLVGDTLRFSARVLDAEGNELSGRTVTWSSSNRDVASVSPEGLVSTLAAGEVEIRATSEGRTAVARLTVLNYEPTIISLSPPRIGTNLEGWTISITGQNFVSGSIANWNGQARPTTYVSRTELRMEIPPTDVARPSTAEVTVVSPPPGGGESEPIAIVVEPGNAVVTTLPATDITATSATLHGSVEAFGSSYTYTFLVGEDPAQLDQVPAEYPVFSGSGSGTHSFVADHLGGGKTYYYRIMAHATAAGPSYGEILSFTTEPEPITLTDLEPSATSAGSEALTLSVYGNGFRHGDVVRFHGSERLTTLEDSGLLEAYIRSSDLDQIGRWAIDVLRPSTGVTSNRLDFTVEGAPPRVETMFLSELGESTATLRGTARGWGTSFTWFFDWGTVPTQMRREGQITTAEDGWFSLSLRGLEQGVTYYYRFGAVNEYGENLGVVRSFRLGSGVPGITLESAEWAAPDTVKFRFYLDQRAGGILLRGESSRSADFSNPVQLYPIQYIAGSSGTYWLYWWGTHQENELRYYRLTAYNHLGSAQTPIFSVSSVPVPGGGGGVIGVNRLPPDGGFNASVSPTAGGASVSPTVGGEGVSPPP